VDSEAPGSIEPHLVAGAGERLEQREAVASGAVAEAVTLLVAMGSRVPDELGAGEDELFVEILPGAGEDSGRSRAPLEADPAVSCPRELAACRSRPVGEPVLADRVPGECGCGPLARASSGSSRSRTSVLPAAPCNVPRPR
jgi:hypothetical protein